MSIFDWVTDTFGQTKMNASPSVMEEGTKVHDPAEEAAKFALQRDKFYADLPGYPEPPVPAQAGPIPVMPETRDEFYQELPGYPQPVPPATPPVSGLDFSGYEQTPDLLDTKMGVPPVQDQEVPPVGGWADMSQEDFVDEFGVPPVPESDGTVPEIQGWEDMTQEDFVEEYAEPLTTPDGVDETDTEFAPATEADPDLSPDEAEEVVKTLDESPEVPGGATKDQVKEVAAKDPKNFRKAMDWFSKTFGINGQDLARMALFYVGSRVAGYDHSGSMTFAFEEGIKDSRGRGLMAHQLTESGKYTTKSIQEFKKTGDRSKLKLTTKPNPLKIDRTKPFVDGNGKKWFKATDSTGSTYFIDGKGNTTTETLKADEVPLTRKERVEAGGKKMTPLVNEFVDSKGGNKPNKDGQLPNPKWQILPTTGGNNIAEIIVDELDGFGMDTTDAVNSRVAKAALEMAWADSKNPKFKGTVNDISPYVQAQLQYYTQQEPWQQQLMFEGEPLEVERYFDLKDRVMRDLKNDPAYGRALAAGYTEAQLIDVAFKSVFEQWKTTQGDKPDKNGDAFYRYLMNNT